jgi:hypothetical protein
VEIAGLLLMVQVAAAAPSGPCVLPLTPPPPFAGWTRPGPLTAAEAVDVQPPLPTLVPGRAASVTLAPAERVRFPAPPHGADKPVRYGGLVWLEVGAAGTYRVALGAPAWVDVMAPAGTALPEAGHAHGQPCSGVAKSVDFRLLPGRYPVAFSAAPGPVMTVEVAPVP